MEAHRPFFVLHRLLSCPSQQLLLRPKTDFLYINHIAGAKKKGKNLVGGFNPLSQILIKLEYFPK